MGSAILAEGLGKRFGTETALESVDLEAEEGTVLGVLGPNGAGKTTTVRILATLLRPDRGRAFVCGHDVVRSPDRVRGLLGLTGQFAAVDENLTGTENLVLLARLLGMSRRASRALANELLGRFDLLDAAERTAKTYSGGMRRRLDLAACLVGDPRVIVLDEPTTGLDPNARDQLWEVIRGQVRRGTTVLLTTQYLAEADQLCDDIVVIDRGAVAARGTPSALKQQIGGPTLAVRPTEDDDLPQVRLVLDDVLGEHTVEEKTAKGPARDAAAMSTVLRALDERGVGVAEFAVREPSLDEVFRQLTAKEAA